MASYDRHRNGTPEVRRQQRERRHRLMLEGVLTPPHGSYGTYTNYMCRCEPCTEANRVFCRERKRMLRARARTA